MYSSQTEPASPAFTPLSSGNINAEQMAELVVQYEASKIRVIELEEQLSLTKHNFQMQMNQLTARHEEKNQFFLSLIQEMQDRHSKQVAVYQGQLANYQLDKVKMSALEHKMSEIGSGIEEFIEQSKLLSKANEELERKILEKNKIIEQMVAQIQNLNEQVEDYQTRMQNYQKLKLKYIKKNKDIGELILQAELSISSLTPNEDNLKASVLMCASTGHKSSECNHCKLASLQKKYSRLLN